MRIGLLTSHPIQHQAPWFRAAARSGVSFDWDVDLLIGYTHSFLVNRARAPSTMHFNGCDTPEIAEEIARGGFDAFVVTGWHLKCFW